MQVASVDREEIPTVERILLGPKKQSCACTLLIATVNQSNPRAQYCLDISLRNREVYRDNPRIFDIMLAPKRGIGISPEITLLEQKEYENHIDNWTGNTCYVNNVPMWQTRDSA